MAEAVLFNAIKMHVLSEKERGESCFPKIPPTKTGGSHQSAPVVCYRCGLQYSAASGAMEECCVYHEDMFVLAIPSEHVGLVMGKKLTTRSEIVKSSGVRRLQIPGNQPTTAQIEIEGTIEAVERAEQLIKRKLHRQIKLSQGKWSCCKSGAKAKGCHTSGMHVSDIIYQDNQLFVETSENSINSPGRVFSLDSEWVNTRYGAELARVTVLDFNGSVCYDTLVLPPHPVCDYNTRYSGITEDNMEGVTVSIMEVQEKLTKMIYSKDILVGHSLNHDLQVLHIVHCQVVDTSIVFPHQDGPAFKNSLKYLARKILCRTIQQDQDGHDSNEDALACLNLMKKKASWHRRVYNYQDYVLLRQLERQLEVEKDVSEEVHVMINFLKT